jgi:hypothetical protein
MGWITGLGLKLLMQTLQLIRPTDVIQFYTDAEPKGNGPKKNLPRLSELGLFNRIHSQWWPQRNLVTSSDLRKWRPTIHHLETVQMRRNRY